MVKVSLLLMMFLCQSPTPSAAASDVRNEGGYILDNFPSPQIQPENEKFPDYKSDESQARERAKDYYSRYIAEYQRIWREQFSGKTELPRLEGLAQRYMTFCDTSNRLDKLRNLSSEEIKSVLDNTALFTLAPSAPEPEVSIDENQYPDRLTKLEQARERALEFVKAYIDAVSNEWKVTRGSPFSLPGVEIVRERARRAIRESTDLKDLNSSNPVNIRFQATKNVRLADNSGAMTMNRLFEERLATLSGHVDASDSLEKIQSDLEAIRLQIQRRSDKDQFRLKTYLMKELSSLKQEVDQLGTNLVVLALFLILCVSWWSNSIRLGRASK